MINIKFSFVFLYVGFLGNIASANEDEQLVASIQKIGGKITRDRTKANSIVEINLQSTPFTDEMVDNLIQLKNLISLDLRDTKISNSGLKSVGKLFSLKKLALGSSNGAISEITDVGKKELLPLKNLSELILKCTLVTDSGAMTISNLSKLRLLDLSSSSSLSIVTSNRISDNGLRKLAVLDQLEELYLSGNNQLTGEGLSHLSRLKNLSSLDLSKSGLTDLGLLNVAKLSNLKVLNIGDTRHISDNGIKSIVSLQRLQELDLWGTGITDNSLKEIGKLYNIKILTLSYTKITDNGLSELSLLINLSILNLSNTNVTGIGFSKLKNLTNLTNLSLASNPLTDNGIESIVLLSNLSNLDISGSRRGEFRNNQLADIWIGPASVTDFGVSYLSKLSKLKSLNLSGMRKITDLCSKDICQIRSLTALDMSGTMITNKSLGDYAELDNLNELHIGGIILEGRLNNLTLIKNLEILRLSGRKISDDAVADLFRCKSLQHITIQINEFNHSMEKKLRMSLPSCDVVVKQ